MKLVLAALACAFSSIALAAPPPAPVISVGVTDVRQLEFNWAVVPRVQTYELWYQSAPGAPWSKYAEKDARNSPLFRIGVPVHLLNWSQALFHVKACNPVDGCTASNNVSVNHLKVDAIGFIKPASTNAYLFGHHVAVSADGKTLAVLNGENIGSVTQSLTVHVYRKTSPTSGWRREARLVPSIVQDRTSEAFDFDNLALSGDGNVLVLGSPYENGPGPDLVQTGAVYVFRRSGSTWRLAQRFASSFARDFIGGRVKIDDAGRTLVFTHARPWSASPNSRAELYRSAGADQPFNHQMTLSSNSGTATDCAGVLALSGDGNTVLQSCNSPSGTGSFVRTGPTFAATAELHSGNRFGAELSYDGTAALIQDFQGSYAYRLGASGWVREKFLTNGEGDNDLGGRQIALSRDGNIAAVANYGERVVGIGPLYPPYTLGSQETANGGVLIYQRKSTGWELRRLVKPGSANVGWAGISLSMGANGNLLAVGAPLDPSAATGIDGDRDDESAPNRGAVWLY